MQTMEELGAIAENNTTLQNEDSARDASSSDDSSQTAELEFGQFLGTPILIEVRKELLGKKTEPLLHSVMLHPTSMKVPILGHSTKMLHLLFKIK